MRGEALAWALGDERFVTTLAAAIKDRELIKQFDRLKGHNLSRSGTGLDLAIDDASGRTESALDDFTDFVWDIAQRLPP